MTTLEMPAIANTCDCNYDFDYYKPCVPQSGASCIQSLKCKVIKFPNIGTTFGCTSFDHVAIERRIQNQSRMPTSQFTNALQDVTVAQDRLSFKGSINNFTSLSSRVWGNANYLRNQSDRSTPSRSGAYVAPNQRNPAFGKSLNIPGYVNAPTRGNSTKSTITANRPGAMTPGGQGVDVKHGSYARYLARKKGNILTRKKQTVTQTQPLPVSDAHVVNNMSYKFTPVSLNITPNKQNCRDCNLSIFNKNN
jgi:hypothetical protein